MKFRFIRSHDPEYQQELMLRWEALRKPLGMPPGSERLPDDEQGLHLLAMEGKKVVGCVLFYPEGDRKGRLDQMAVSEEYRGRGFGRKLLLALEQALTKKGFKDLYLYSGVEAVGFYERMGYQKEGESVVKLGQPHHLMKKILPA